MVAFILTQAYLNEMCIRDSDRYGLSQRVGSHLGSVAAGGPVDHLALGVVADCDSEGVLVRQL